MAHFRLWFESISIDFLSFSISFSQFQSILISLNHFDSVKNAGIYWQTGRWGKQHVTIWEMKHKETSNFFLFHCKIWEFPNLVVCNFYALLRSFAPIILRPFAPLILCPFAILLLRSFALICALAPSEQVYNDRVWELQRNSEGKRRAAVNFVLLVFWPCNPFVLWACLKAWLRRFVMPGVWTKGPHARKGACLLTLRIALEQIPRSQWDQETSKEIMRHL